ncbi:unnamed protein product [Gongylonema pulchrum]|uniref:Uncharacterized protein n=1 Tax=Gongylonema pulchrum TaxID=637853 RepID=A0A183DU11_9BILA|nr:unnamed protein product [Gongylonema pulchrum]
MVPSNMHLQITQQLLYLSGHLHEIDNFKKQIDSYEVQITTMRRQNDELDTQMKTNLARISGMETTLAAAQREIEKITELNNRLQMDKNELGGAKQKGETELNLMRERIRKLEQDIERLKKENQANTVPNLPP